jgi:iron complex outermembrane receptor protein
VKERIKFRKGAFVQDFLLGGLFCLISGALSAQKLSDTIRIQEVQIYGKKPVEEAASLVTHIDTMALQMMKTQTVAELLSSYSPVFIKSYGRGSTATASFRGTAPSHTQVYWNGIRLNSPMRGDVDFSLFPVYLIDDVSLQFGGSSLQSGSGALGGSILLGNKPDWNERTSIRYVQSLESFSTDREYLNLGFGNRKIQLKTRLFSDRSQNDFPYFNYGRLPMHQAIQKNADYSKQGLLQEVYFKAGQNTFSARIWAYRSHRNLPQLMSFEGDARTEKQTDHNFRVVLSWNHYAPKSKIDWVGGINRSELDYFRSSTEANVVNFDSHGREKSWTSHVDFDWTPSKLLNFNWSWSTTYDLVSVFDRAQKLGYDHNRLELSLLNAVHWLATDQVSLSFLWRSELYNSRLIGLIPSLGLEYFLTRSQQHSLKLNLARNYHQPALNDLYWLPGGNPDLKPEKGFSGDLVYAFAGRKDGLIFSGQVSAFASLIDDWIVWQPSSGGAYFWEAANLRKVFSRGAGIQFFLQKTMANTIRFDLKGNYSYTATANVNAVPSVDHSRGKQLIYIPKHKANLFGEAVFKAWYLKLNAPFTGKRYTLSNNEESDYEKILTSFWLVNLNLGKTFDIKRFRADVNVGIENLANADYMAILWRPMPGRTYSLTIQLSYKK